MRYTNLNKIKTGDILLFKSSGFLTPGWWISKYTQSPYSHVGIAYWDNCVLRCIEFREFIGSRNEPLINQLNNKSCGRIDVFRPCNIWYDTEEGKVEHNFTPEVAKQVVDFANSLVGQRYGWKNIWKMFKSYSPFLRFFNERKTNDDLETKIYVCSTLIVASYRKFWVDLVPLLADEYVSPGDIGTSAVIRKVLTIECE